MKFLKYLIPIILLLLISTNTIKAQEILPENTIDRIQNSKNKLQDRIGGFRDNTENKKGEEINPPEDDLDNKPKEKRLERISDRARDENKSIEERRESLKARAEERKERLEERIEERKERLEERIEERKTRADEKQERLNERKKDVVKKHLNNIFERFAAAIDRLRGISDRIQSRIDKFNDKGANTNEAQNLLDSAILTLDNTETDVIAIKDTIIDSLEDELSKETIKDLIIEAKNKIKNSHQAFVEVIRILKAVKTETEPTEDESQETSDKESSETDSPDENGTNTE